MELNPENLTSSYRKNHYGEVFQAISFIQKPKLTVEIGVLEGYSAMHLKKYSEKMMLCDLFDKYKYKHADLSDVQFKFPDALVHQLDFYTEADFFDDGSIDLLHIDISNTGDTYRHFLKAYWSKLAPGGIALLEGGSEERDNHWWMKSFNKPTISQALLEFHVAKVDYHVLELFPSLTIVRK